MDTLDNAASFDRDHLREQQLDALGGATAQVALATLGTHHYARPGDTETFRGRLMGLEFIVFVVCLRGTAKTPSHTKPRQGEQRYKPGEACSPMPAGNI